MFDAECYVQHSYTVLLKVYVNMYGVHYTPTHLHNHYVSYICIIIWDIYIIYCKSITEDILWYKQIYEITTFSQYY